MTVTSKPLTNSAYGFPARGDVRRGKPQVLCVIHITGNPQNQGPTAALNERNYANRKDSPGPSAHYYVDRDGDSVRAINADRYAAWSNGDLKSPDTSNAGVRYLIGLRAAGRNPNEGVALEIECVGFATAAGQITGEQIDTVARLIAIYSKRLHLPINRQTVLTHADINSETRPSCAFLASRREIRMAELINRAKQYAAPPLPRTVVVKWDAIAPPLKRTIVTWTPSGLVTTHE